MANQKKLVRENVEGDFFVDTTCINCDTCRQLAPTTFADQGDFSFVRCQPQKSAEEVAAMHALLACPVGSIGNRSSKKPDVTNDFPLPLLPDVFYSGFNSEQSYGGNSFFITHPQGNWLIDAPRYVAPLVKKLHTMGGIKYIFLTHRDDVADATKYAAEFKAQRIINRLELDAQPEAEIIIDAAVSDVEKNRAIDFAQDFKIIQTPGHTRGHMVLLYKDQVLFSGDHLSYDSESKRLNAHEAHCWYSWSEQVKSLERLTKYDFEWLLAGHSNRVHLDAGAMKQLLQDLVSSASRS